MKKMMLLLVGILLMSCSDDIPTRRFFVNVYERYANESDIDADISPKAFLYLYRDMRKEIDFPESTTSVLESGVLTYKDGTKSQIPAFMTTYSAGVFDVEVPEGRYIMWTTTLKDEVNTTYSSSKEIFVHKGWQDKLEKKIFVLSNEDKDVNRYQEW